MRDQNPGKPPQSHIAIASLIEGSSIWPVWFRFIRFLQHSPTFHGFSRSDAIKDCVLSNNKPGINLIGLTSSSTKDLDIRLIIFKRMLRNPSLGLLIWTWKFCFKSYKAILLYMWDLAWCRCCWLSSQMAYSRIYIKTWNFYPIQNMKCFRNI